VAYVNSTFMTALSSALETLANYRTDNTRASQDTFEKGAQILKSDAISKLGDDGECMA